MKFMLCLFFFFFSSRRRHTRLQGDWSSDVCSSDLIGAVVAEREREERVAVEGRVGRRERAREAEHPERGQRGGVRAVEARVGRDHRSEEHTSDLQSPCNLVCRLLLEKKNNHDVWLAKARHGV